MPRARWSAVIPTALLLAGTLAASAEETLPEAERYWPQWRGPAMTGASPGGDPPVEWSETKNVRFKVAIPGQGLASPIVWGERVFVQTAVPVGEATVEDEASAEEPGRRRRGVAPTQPLRFEVLALAREDGRELWRRTAAERQPHEGTHPDGTWASNSPVTDGERLYAYFGSQGLFCYSLEGEPCWSKDLGDMQTRNAFGEGSSPAVWGDILVVNWDHEGDSFLVALDKRTGEERWRAGRDEPTSWSTPVIVEVEGKPQVIVAATERTRGYDLATGDVVWQAGGMTLNVVPTPVVDGGVAYVTSGFRGNALQAIRLAGAKGEITGTEAVVWSHDRHTPYVPSPLLYGGQLYFLKTNTGILSVLDAATGRVLYDETRLDDVQGVYASPVAADGRVYVVGRNGVTVVLDHGPEHRVLATNTLDDRFDASPAIVGEELYLRGREHLYCIAEDGEAGAGSEQPAEATATGR